MSTEILFGEGGINALGQHLARLGLERALLVTGSHAERSGLTKALIRASAGRIVDYFCDVSANPTVKNVEDCLLRAKENKVDCLVAVGGGSVMDCAKIAGGVLCEGITVKTLLDGHQITGMLPLICAPTTAGTSSELTSGAVISCGADNEKRMFSAPAMRPMVAIIDPELTYSCPESVTASAGADVLAHIFDSMASPRAGALTNDIAVAAASKVFVALPAAVKNGMDQTARRWMCEASTMAGMAFSQTATSSSHACSYALTSRYGVAHGEACALTLDAWVRLSGPRVEGLQSCAAAMGYKNTDELADALDALFSGIGLRRTLREMGVQASEISFLVDSAMASPNLKNSIVEITKEQLDAVLCSKF